MKSTSLLILCCALSLAALSQSVDFTAQFWVEVVTCDPLEERNELEKFTSNLFSGIARHRYTNQSHTIILLTDQSIGRRLFILQQSLLI